MPTPTTNQIISALYVATFNRAPDKAGLTFWQQQFTVNSAAAVSQLAAGFASHPVFTEQYGSLTNLAFVQAIYTNVLGSPGDAAGILFWNDALNAGLSRSNFLAAFVESALSADLGAALASGALTQAEYDAAVIRQDWLTNKADVGLQYANTLGAASNLSPTTDTSTSAGLNADPAYQASIAILAGVDNTNASEIDAITLINDAAASSNPVAFINDNAASGVVGETFTLTTAIETLTGTAFNDTFVGIINDNGATNSSTAQTGDILKGGDGRDTLNLTVARDGGTAPLVELNSVEVVNIRQLDAGANNLNASLWTGTQQISSLNSLEWSYVTDVQNGVVIGETGARDAAVEIQYAAGALGTTTYEQVFDLNNLSNSTIGQLDVHVDIAGGTDRITAVKINATGSNFIEVGGGTAYGNIEKLTVTGNGALDVSEHGGAFGDATVVDLSANTGGVTTELSHEDVVVTGGTGADIITLSNGVALTNKAGINLGAGNDALLNSGSAGVGTAAVLDGGIGTDTIASTLLQVGNQANIKNFEIMDLAGENRTIDASLFTASTFSSLALTDATAGNVTVSKLAGTSIVLDDTSAAVDGNTVTATLKTSTGTADSAAINFNGDGSSSLGGFTSTGLETVTINSSAVNAADVNALGLLSITDNVLTGVTITGANDFTLGGVAVNTAATTASANVAAALTSIDGSAATGDLNITAGAAAAIGVSGFDTTYNSLTIKTGSGDDVVSIGGRGTVETGTGADQVDVAVLGVSVNVGVDEAVDTVVLANTADFTGAVTTSTRQTSISNLATNDTINFSSIENAATTVNNFTTTANTFSSFETAANAALADGTSAVDFFNWVDGNTYIVVDGVDDTIIQLVGSYDSFTLAAGVVTIG